MGHRTLRRATAQSPAALASVFVLFTAFTASIASAGIHTWDVREVFSNASGTIQYIELFDAGAGGLEVGVGNGSLTSVGQSHTWANGAVAPPTNGKSYLIASASFAALPGAPTPDVIIPANKLPFFNVNGDTIGFAGVNSWAFGAVPTNGTNSLNRITGVGANTPKNYAGTQGNVNAAPPPVPSASFWTRAALFASLAGVAIVALRRFRAAAQS